ncbi:hypothetical protein ASPZODRAFT_57875 [Penicilliopsis zonata CBS 506.65]|uniref:Sulfatase N-terminal domain-containing protein n=1 Tax=Penicilliopsis zonata CBS 506.65 TaxID=1073090 RepID=A0A1L9SSX5_9EURO|nr:hypothetical protein ASPZODRAFT_57875 [Penicilliopsis zonata CBS 506.65]OJJ50184.1 hypothetical protein ASPZODRAFT_57875 [Penicilliopsis zonata CBS 506.65]
MSKNILFLIADDLGKCLSSYGTKGLSTPHMDQFISQSVTFDQAFTSTASCSASRTVMYTGLHPHETGQYGLAGGNAHFQTFEHIQTGPKLFNALGYQTGIIGKVHVGPGQVFPWEVREESGSRNVAWVAERAEAFLDHASETKRPFFLTVGFIDPHRDITTRGEFGNSETCNDTFIPPEIKPDEVEIPPWLTDVAETRIEYVEYYKAIARLDYGVGLILDAVHRRGLDESTLVVLCSDNGPPFINSKTTLYEAGIQLPFIMRVPGSSQGIHNPNMISYIDILPTFLDWAETQPPPPPRRLGRSFLSIVNREDVLDEQHWQHQVYGSHTFHEVANYWPTRFLRNRRFKYHRNIAWQLDFPFASDLYASLTLEGIRRNHLKNDNENDTDDDVMVGSRSLRQYVRRPREELYDLETDAQEVNNLVASEAHQTILVRMRNDLEKWQADTRDPWLLRDGQSVVALQRYAADGLKMPNKADFVLDSVAYSRMKQYRVDDPALLRSEE